ncbi:uncharacterized protein N0V89_005481 [Didymosphaeria variabile]|uniref:Uncharacterized protein n=1 Tax=Didymosphaeria variabile TaxID=1932322 RepID=A0A9W9CAI3_9PLEO|nr:uncharacterized protein N0V89_005481 [Didymosphaeria variabile]KAJ4353751.1 hypothetical protein N0V89_005481 [Didymosphaeria variabile]
MPTTNKPTIDQAVTLKFQHLKDTVVEWGIYSKDDLRITIKYKDYQQAFPKLGCYKKYYKYQAKIKTHEKCLVEGGWEKDQEGALEALDISIGKMNARKMNEKSEREKDKKQLEEAEKKWAEEIKENQNRKKEAVKKWVEETEECTKTGKEREE